METRTMTPTEQFKEKMKNEGRHGYVEPEYPNPEELRAEYGI